MTDAGRIESRLMSDTESIAKWYPRLRREAVRQLPKSLLDRVGPDDLVQETLLVGLCNLDKTIGRTEGETRAWLSVILRNRIRMALRHYCRRQGETSSIREQNLTPDIWDSILQNETDQMSQLMHDESVEKLRLRIDRLPADLRQIVVWRFFDRQDFEWIADRLNISARQSRRRLEQAIDQIIEGWNHGNTGEE
jgi:RNA polymerase sigma factor (sigma-70 family)